MSDSASLRYHLAQLTELCRAHPLAAKIVFLPTVQIGHNMGTTLAQAGVSWVNLHLTTPAAWAERLTGPRLRAAGWRPLVQGADLFFMLERVKRIAWPNSHPLSSGRSAAGIAETFLRTIRGLRLAGIGPEELTRADVGLGGPQVFSEVYRDYCRWLTSEKLYDRADLYEAAGKAPRPDDYFVAVFDETPLPESAYRFVEGLSKDIRRIGRPNYGAPAPQHSARQRFEGAPLVADGAGTTGPAGRLLEGSGIDPAEGDPMVVREAVGIENEVRGALRELLRQGTALDEIEIAYTSEDPYLPLLLDVLERLGLPATYAAGVPVTSTTTGQALIGFFRWIASGFDVDELVSSLRGRLLFIRRERGAPDVDAGEAAAILLEARVGSGRRTWDRVLERYTRRLSAEADGAAGGKREYLLERKAKAQRLRGWLRELVDIVPPEEMSTLEATASAGAAFVDRFAERRTERDARAAESVRDRLSDLAECPAAEGALDELARSLAKLASEHKIEAAVARPGHAYVVPLERAGYTGRRQTIVIGLAESTFPGAVMEDPILLDDERRRIAGDRLVLHRARANEPAWHLIRLLGAASHRILLTANRRDLTVGRETYPAPLFEQLKDQLGVKHPPVYGLVPTEDEALTRDEAALALRYRASTTADVLAERPWLESGLEAVRGRTGEALGRHDGWLEKRTPELRPGGTDVLSASRLEDLATCPYRYFLRNVLRVRPPDLPEDLPGHWLTPLEFGSLLHDTLRRFMEAVTRRGEAVDADRHASLMSEVLDERIAEFRERVPVRQRAGYRVDRRRLERAVRIFLAEESRRSVRPVGFEVSFGMGSSKGLDAPEPVRLTLSDDVVISLRGSIDRVDEVEGGYEVWDYKTGSGYDFDEMDMLCGGRRLQWALYAFVLDELLDRAGIEARTVRSGYFFTSDREHGLRLDGVPPARADVGRALAPLFDMVENGAFPHVQKNNACTFCDYHAVCASERKGKRDVEGIVEASGDSPFVSALERWMSV